MKEFIYDGNEKNIVDYLKDRYGLSFSMFCKHSKENKIKVNGKKINQSYKLTNGDVIKLFFNTLEENNIVKDELDIVFEDDNVIIVNKPQGLLVNSENNTVSDTLINRVLKYLDTPLDSSFTPCLCHRLDQNTSGIVLIAKNKNTKTILEKIIKDHSLLKEYTAITASLPKESGEIKSYLLKDAQSSFVKCFKNNVKGAKEAILNYKRIDTNKNFALVKIALKTGRTHQIRVQFASINAPILGDTKYGNIAINNLTKIKRQVLCASRIVFPKLHNELSYLSNKEFSVNTDNITSLFKSL